MNESSDRRGEEESSPDEDDPGRSDQPEPDAADVTARGRQITESLLRALGQKSVSELRGDVRRGTTETSLVASAKDVDETDFARRKRESEAKAATVQNEILEAERDRLKQQQSHRSKFFLWSIVAVSCVLVFNGVIFWWYMSARQGQPSDTVLISWMSTSIVEFIGLAYIIARSLFQSVNNSAAVSRADRKARGKKGNM